MLWLAQPIAKGPLPELWCNVERRDLCAVCYLAGQITTQRVWQLAAAQKQLEGEGITPSLQALSIRYRTTTDRTALQIAATLQKLDTHWRRSGFGAHKVLIQDYYCPCGRQSVRQLKL